MINKKFFGIIFGLLVCFGFLSCTQPTDDEESNLLYYYETGKISKSNYETIMATYPGGFTYSAGEVYYIRNVTKAKVNGLESHFGLTESDLYNFCLSSGVTPSEYKTYYNCLYKTGNIIVFFNITNDTSNMQYFYVEKEGLSCTSVDPNVIIEDSTKMLYSVTKIVDNVSYTASTPTEIMKGIYFNSISNYILYVDDETEGNNSIKIDTKNKTVSNGFNCDYPSETYLSSSPVETTQGTKYTIHTHYYDCIVYIKIEEN